MDFSGSEIFLANKYEILPEMGPYGSVGAHIKTGRSHMAQDHFKTPPDPKMAHQNKKIPKNPGWGRAGIFFLNMGQRLVVTVDSSPQVYTQLAVHPST